MTTIAVMGIFEAILTPVLRNGNMKKGIFNLSELYSDYILIWTNL